MNVSAISKSFKRWSIALIVAVAALATVTTVLDVFRSKQGEIDNSSPELEAAPVLKKVTALGRLEPETEIIRLFPPSALDNPRVARLLVKQGDKVEADQTIAILANKDRLQAALAEATENVKVAKRKLAQVQAGAKTGEIAAQKAQVTQLRSELQGQIATNQAEIKRWQSEVRTAKTEYERNQYLYREGAIAASVLDGKRLALETAQAQLEQAIATKDRTTKTLESQIVEATENLNNIAEVRPVDLDTAQAEVAAAISAAKRAEIELAQAYVRTPIAGRVLKIHTYPGETVNEQNGIAQLGQTEQMVVVAEVYQTDINKVRLGQSATITSDIFSEKLQGTVNQIDLLVSQQNVFSDRPGENLDRRVVEVKIVLNPEDSEKVAGLSNLQVQTAIQIEANDGRVLNSFNNK